MTEMTSVGQDMAIEIEVPFPKEVEPRNSIVEWDRRESEEEEEEIFHYWNPS